MLSSRKISGLTLIELLVTLFILSVLAAVALPYAEVTIRRDKEIELRQALRDIRNAIDEFHTDWQAGLMSDLDSVASQDGYPISLEILVSGINIKGEINRKKRYLRKIPRDPLADSSQTQWILRGYQDDEDTIIWNGEDVYDVRTTNNSTAINGTRYEDW